MPAFPPSANAADRRAHAWVPPVAALLLLLWVLATLGSRPTGGMGHADADVAAGGPTAGGTGHGNGTDAGAGTGDPGAGPGAAASGVAAGSDADASDPTGAAAAAETARPADPAETTNDASPPTSDAPATRADGPVRDRRLGFSRDLLAPDPSPTPEPVARVAAPASPAASGAEGAEGAPGAGGNASFFGQEGRGTRFVYVIDRSGSMAGSRFAAARFELIKSIRSLGDGASFQVVFYDNQTLLMPRPGMLRATPAHKEQAVDWIRGVEPGGGTDPSGALEHALTRLRPTTIWLLSDGAFSEDVARQLRRSNPRARVQINTIAFQNRGGEALLKTIAAENDGDYRYVEK